ncbi:hypothetical protein WN59_12000 [Salinicoccus sediminis]|uniref:Uncharacterized protein n=1 Tax=Salinicoccus sediminis TaxID=1432562 RepID=A0A0M2SLJ9_9STAP|nr:DUF58 domain-containing protein [Salinicoccus sediminis]KKK33465.1 hypothetical protein WN59_12000 [Salinicoccus sediminis]
MKFKPDFSDSKTMNFFTGSVLILFILNIFYGIQLNRLIAISLGLFISFALLNYLYERNVAEKLRFEIIDKEIRMFKNQNGVLRIRVSQDGMLPILAGRLTVSAGDDIRFQDDISTGVRQHTITAVTFTVMPKSRTLIEIPFSGYSRGVSKIVRSELKIPRIFGFGSIDLKQHGKTGHEIIIYPDRHAVHNREMENRMMPGEFTERNALFSDPLMTNGTRVYIPDDSMRDIHWKASAKTGELQTRLYDKMTRVSWLILINLRSENSYAPPGNIETIFEKIAFVTGKAAEAGIPYKIITNMVMLDSRSFFSLGKSTGSLHYRRTLETLARTDTVTYTLHFERLLRHVQMHEEIPTHVIFTGVADDPISQSLSVLEAKGAHVFQLDDYGIIPFESRKTGEARR